MVPQLLALTEGPNIPVDKPILLLGRHQECDLQIPSRKISRRHCCIAQVDHHLFIKDLFSTNGIRINGVRVPDGVLRDGDELTIGNFSYRVHWPEAAVPKAIFDAPIQANLPQSLAKAGDPDLSMENPVLLRDDFQSAPIGFPLVLPVNKESMGHMAIPDDSAYPPLGSGDFPAPRGS